MDGVAYIPSTSRHCTRTTFAGGDASSESCGLYCRLCGGAEPAFCDHNDSGAAASLVQHLLCRWCCNRRAAQAVSTWGIFLGLSCADLSLVNCSRLVGLTCRPWWWGANCAFINTTLRLSDLLRHWCKHYLG